MLHSSFYKYYNFKTLENYTISGAHCSVNGVNTKLTCNFVIRTENRLELVQTFFLLYQFFKIRPSVKSVRKLHKPAFFLIQTAIRGRRAITFFNFVRRLRISQKCKLVTISYKEQGTVCVSFQDFITLYPFRIGKFDFHNWRKSLIVANSAFSDYEKNILFDFYNVLFSNIKNEG